MARRMSAIDCKRDYSLRRRGSDGRVVDIGGRIEHILQPKNRKRGKTSDEVLTTEEVRPERERKASFDRFGDDLVELIVTYLPIEDKFRFECLSKQVRRLVFNKHYVLEVRQNDRSFGHKLLTDTNKDNPKLKAKEFEKCLIKLKNLSHIDIGYEIEITSQHINAIAKHCHHLRSLAIDWNKQISEKSVKRFGEKCGKSLRSLTIYSSDEEIDSLSYLLSLTTELVEFNIGRIDSRLLIDSNKDKVLPKLKRLGINTTDDYSLIELQEHYGQQLVSLKIQSWVEISPVGKRSIHRAIQGFKRFRQLKTLEIKFALSNLIEVEDQFNDQEMNDEYVVEKLRQNLNQMADNCLQLRRLYIGLIYINSKIISTSDVSSLFTRFIQLTHLSLRFDYQKAKVLNLIGLQSLTRLKSLNLVMFELSDKHFENIGQYLPRLKSLSVQTEQVLTHKSLDYISQLKQLETLVIYCDLRTNSPKLSSRSVKHLLESLPNLTTLVLKHWTSIESWDDHDRSAHDKCLPFISQAIAILEVRAKNRPKISYYLGVDAKPFTGQRNLPANMSIKCHQGGGN